MPVKARTKFREANEAFMRAFKRYRMARGYTLHDLAGKLHVATSTVAAWESGRNLPRPNHVPKLARLFEIDPVELTTIISPEPVPRPFPASHVT